MSTREVPKGETIHEPTRTVGVGHTRWLDAYDKLTGNQGNQYFEALKSVSTKNLRAIMAGV